MPPCHSGTPYLSPPSKLRRIITANYPSTTPLFNHLASATALLIVTLAVVPARGLDLLLEESNLRGDSLHGLFLAHGRRLGISPLDP